MARSTAAPNLTSTALAGALPGDRGPVREEVPFSSALRWSAVRTVDELWVLGAPEALAEAIDGEDLGAEVVGRTSRGLRVLLFARAADPWVPLRDAAGRPVLPELQPLALVALADELRPDVVDTVAEMTAEGIAP